MVVALRWQKKHPRENATSRNPQNVAMTVAMTPERTLISEGVS
jgi:hypothetical protein